MTRYPNVRDELSTASFGLFSGLLWRWLIFVDSFSLIFMSQVLVILSLSAQLRFCSYPCGADNGDTSAVSHISLNTAHETVLSRDQSSTAL